MLQAMAYLHFQRPSFCTWSLCLPFETWKNMHRCLHIHLCLSRHSAFALCVCVCACAHSCVCVCVCVRMMKTSLLTQGRASVSSSAPVFSVSLAHTLLLFLSQMARVAHKGEIGLWKKIAAAACVPAARASSSDGLCQSRTFQNATNRIFFFSSFI